ncbi:hypothetical protein WMY93_005238 [Mugilogobius chulae]|uniref:DNA polymerase Y-family little finger domain-containing protein n=1 Tax=Mugilogobius chulae TaxID=88201 RepID=A0AAW0PQX8_9GOBI
MSSLSSLRKVPGIGHQTAKRLQALGVSSIKDLEFFSMDNLVREFGEPGARRLKNLAIGNDDSSVTPTGAPQSLSDEDSFKKMSSTKEVIEKIQELLTSLVERMHKDGRQPLTLRLTIRRYSATNKWCSRESRQSPIPNHTGQKIVTGKFDDAVFQLKSLAMKLFHKMVDPKKAFHLTLINVCFSNLQAKVSTPASEKTFMSFFKLSPSPRKVTSDASHDEGEPNSNRGGCTVDKCNPHNSFTQQFSKEKVMANFQQRMCGFTGTENSFTVLSTGPNTVSTQAESRSPPLPPHIDKEVFSCLPQEIQKEIMFSKTPTNGFTEMVSLKRPTTVNSPGPLDSIFASLKTENSSLPGSSDAQIPRNVDPIVFAQLPPELQKELMSEWKQAKPF